MMVFSESKFISISVSKLIITNHSHNIPLIISGKIKSLKPDLWDISLSIGGSLCGFKYLVEGSARIECESIIDNKIKTILKCAFLELYIRLKLKFEPYLSNDGKSFLFPIALGIDIDKIFDNREIIFEVPSKDYVWITTNGKVAHCYVRCKSICGKYNLPSLPRHAKITNKTKMCSLCSKELLKWEQ